MIHRKEAAEEVDVCHIHTHTNAHTTHVRTYAHISSSMHSISEGSDLRKAMWSVCHVRDWFSSASGACSTSS